MVAVTVGDIDRSQILAALDDPIQQRLGLLDREKSVHEAPVTFAIDERHRIRHTHCSSSLPGGKSRAKPLRLTVSTSH